MNSLLIVSNDQILVNVCHCWSHERKQNKKRKRELGVYYVHSFCIRTLKELSDYPVARNNLTKKAICTQSWLRLFIMSISAPWWCGSSLHLIEIKHWIWIFSLTNAGRVSMILHNAVHVSATQPHSCERKQCTHSQYMVLSCAGYGMLNVFSS